MQKGKKASQMKRLDAWAFRWLTGRRQLSRSQTCIAVMGESGKFLTFTPVFSYLWIYFILGTFSEVCREAQVSVYLSLGSGLLKACVCVCEEKPAEARPHMHTSSVFFYAHVQGGSIRVLQAVI